MLPPAPARLSTTTDWPSVSVSRLATSRARMSVVAPAGKGTTNRIAWFGYACPNAPQVKVANSAASAKRCRLPIIVSSVGPVEGLVSFRSASSRGSRCSVDLGARLLDDLRVLGDLALDQRRELLGRVRRGLGT